MRSNKLIVFLFLLISLIVTSINAQSLDELEKQYERLNNQYLKENVVLDSLKNIFSLRTNVIDNEKKKANPDKNKIVDLMAGSITLSNMIDEQNKKVNLLKKDIDSVKQKLHKRYTSIIDSLELKKKSDSENGDMLDAEILNYTEKKLLVAPPIPLLSFNPEKILGIELDKTKDPKKKALYEEYLNSALKEVDKLWKNTSELSSEIDQIVTLQTKTEKFIEEAELEGGVIHQRLNNVPLNDATSGNFAGGPGIREDVVPGYQVESYRLIFNQLNFDKSVNADLDWKITTENANLDLKEYQKLLKEVKKRLRELKLVLANKTGFHK
jgi:hypothetical protein